MKSAPPKTASAYYPQRTREWETTEDNLIVLLIPKFGNHFFGRLILSKMRQPNYRLKLDEVGTFVWERCDGSKTVEQIEKELHENFGEKVEPVRERLTLFFKSLERSKSLTW